MIIIIIIIIIILICQKLGQLGLYNEKLSCLCLISEIFCGALFLRLIGHAKTAAQHQTMRPINPGWEARGNTALCFLIPKQDLGLSLMYFHGKFLQLGFFKTKKSKHGQSIVENKGFLFIHNANKQPSCN